MKVLRVQFAFAWPGGLNVTARVGTNPYIGPRGWDSNLPDAFEFAPSSNNRARRIAVGKSRAAMLARYFWHSV